MWPKIVVNRHMEREEGPDVPFLKSVTLTMNF